MDKEQVKIIIKNLIDLSNFDRDDLHELSKYADPKSKEIIESRGHKIEKLKIEKEQIIKVTKFEKDRAKEKEYQKNAYQLRKRAKAVGLELLPSGRHSKGKRKEWLKKLEQLEKEIC